MTKARSELTNEDSGRWLITTSHSDYLIDLDARTIRRTPGSGGTSIGFEVERQLVDIVTCRLGERGHFRAAPDSPFDEYTWAFSSTVQAITAVDEPADPNHVS